uniref:Metal dependent phosphohydrolase n=2 Tax=Candidatus Bipolaricaulota TaxID=67810 RepID=H5SNF7_9BACT|nr:metal dependent phosphohydrolase [uncultured Acetothermia bacterium]BAL59377.1 metal dependent phosphohydrolase [Candidatus Acetothermum autotrophicum]
MAELLAKPDTGLLTHLVEVTQLGEKIADRLGLSDPLRTKVLLACTLHDIGKATTDFQEYIRGQRKRAYPHALASLPFALLLEGVLNPKLGLEPTRYEATTAVLTHHSPLSPNLYKGYEKPDYHPELWQALQEIWTLLEEVGVRHVPPLEGFQRNVRSFLNDSPAALLDASFSGQDASKTLRGIFQRLSTEDFARVKAVLHLADWLASAKQPKPEILFLQSGSEPVRQHTQKLKPLRKFQQDAQTAHNAKILWLRAPTGTGKTEALLLWAGATERLIYLLPTQATTNAMWHRLRRIYGDDAVALAHGRAIYILRQESDEDPVDARLFGSVFAKPVTVATLDQYLLSHLNGRHWEERRTLARSATVILDEIHSYEPYTLGLLLEALKREPPARLALASATLPEPLLSLFPPGQLIEAEDTLWSRTRHRLKLCDGMLLEEGVQTALQEARQGSSVLVVANTIRDAQEFYKRLRQAGWENIELLHARFIFRDRQAKEARISKPEPGRIVVATQVVEVSLDISYDVLVTEVAPMDALVQRMGRVNRQGEKPPAPVMIYRQWSEGSQRVYGRELLEWSAELLLRLPAKPPDAELAQATHELYKRVVATPEWERELQDGQKTLGEVQRILGCYTIDLADEELRERFTARRGMVTVEVLPARFLEEAYMLKECDEGWRLPELLVPVPLWWFRQFAQHFRPVSDLNVVQTTLSYNDEFGLHPPHHQEQSVEAAIL